MSRFSRLIQFIGPALLLLAFAASLWRVGSRRAEQARDDIIHLRFAHWQLEAGVEAGLDLVAREYERLHPRVRIEQMRIPERIYGNWLTTQLIGGTAPDLVQLGGVSMNTERVARFFVPLGSLVDEPNPYNEGTDLAGVAWRNTFVDGMEGGFFPHLCDYYGAPVFTSTSRVFYNKGLLRRITGHDRPPATFAEFIALCERARAWSVENRRPLVPVAGTRHNAPFLLEDVFRAQSQAFTFARQPPRNWLADNEDIYSSILRGERGFDDPAMRSAFTLMGQIGAYMPPGFLQLGREDGVFYFGQENALMIAAGCVDLSALADGVRFEVGVFRLPLPTPDDPVHGRFMLGGVAEAGLTSYGPLGLYRGSKHHEQAMDFMRFLTSRRSNETFTRASKWLPVVVGVQPVGLAREFMPQLEGLPGGFVYNWLGDTRRVLDANLHLLFRGTEGPDAFIATLREKMPAAIASDIRRSLRMRDANVARNDVVYEALRQVSAYTTSDPDGSARRKLDVLIESQNAYEMDYYRRLSQIEPWLR